MVQQGKPTMKKNRPQPRINLKSLPPIDPVSTTNSSSQKKCSASSTNTDKTWPKANQAKVLVEGNQGIERISNRETSNFMKLDGTVSGTSNGFPGNIGYQSGSANEGTRLGSAKMQLFQICAANRWKPPVFECCKEEGASHIRMFTFRVGVEIEAWPKTFIECFGAPHVRKKIAADHAAEGALWYLKHEGFVLKN